jgi:TPR repeat protein
MHKCGVGVEWSPALAARWSERAAFVGSGSSLYAFAMTKRPPAAPEDQAHVFRLLRRAAALGSRPAMVRLAIAYGQGIGVAADQRLADDWQSRALAPGDYSYQGYIALAAAYGDGVGVPRDVAKARDLLRQGAEAGNAQVEYMLSRFIADHGGGSVDEAREAILAAATGGNVTAMRTLADRLGYGVSAGGKDGQGWLTAAAGAGDVRAKVALARQGGDDPAASEARLDGVVKGGVCESDQMADLAVAYFALRTDTARQKAMAWLDRAIAIGSPDHQVTYVLGQALASGIAGADLQPKGLALLTEAAEAGMVKAMRQLATGYQSGTLGRVDNALAAQWLERAAAAGDAGSAVDFARLAASGGNPGDLQKAHDYLAKAAETSANAARQLGQLSIQGLFGPAAQAEGTDWLRKAAEGGDVTGMLALSDLYASGAGILPRDPAQSLEWLRRAAVGGDAKAMFKLAAAYEAGFGTATDTALADQWYQRARTAGLSEVGQ